MENYPYALILLFLQASAWQYFRTSSSCLATISDTIDAAPALQSQGEAPGTAFLEAGMLLTDLRTVFFGSGAVVDLAAIEYRLMFGSAGLTEVASLSGVSSAAQRAQIQVPGRCQPDSEGCRDPAVFHKAILSTRSCFSGYV